MAIDKNLLANVIKSGNFDLTRVTTIIESGYVAGEYTEDDRNELLALRDQYLSPTFAAPGIMELYKRIEEKCDALTKKCTELETRIAVLEGGSSTDTPTEPDEYPEWHAWNGVPGSGYAYGDKVTHRGVRYHSEYAGENVWEPGVFGTEALWIIDA